MFQFQVEVHEMGFKVREVVLVLAVCSGLAGCMNEEKGEPTASGVDSPAVAVDAGGNSQAPAGSTPSTPASAANASTPSANSAPEFLYAPATTVQVGTRYGYRAAARDADGDALTWSVTNLPVWAAFDRTTGDLVGTPGTQHAGAWNNIAITASDGRLSRTLTPFSITVSQSVANGSASLSWTPPYENEDSSPLTNLAGYRIYAGPSSNAMTLLRTISSPGITTAVLDGLATGTVYFAVSAFTSTGIESDRSILGSKTIR